MTTNAEALMIMLPSEREIVVTRAFRAPRRLVWDAQTKPDLLKRWLLGPEGWSMPVCEMDLRVGGRYRWVWRRDDDGTEMASGGIFKEIVAPERLVTTEQFEQPWYPGEGINTIVLTESGGQTTLKQTLLYETREIRDGVLKSGMESGVETSYQRLERILADGGA
ncbi:MAG TPA: SRPBCC family protein [Thermoanaerobaculia bacterium]|jgi:uncharacterized protein YndB with AHSA1/START domain